MPNAWVANVTINRSLKEVLRLPLGTGDNLSIFKMAISDVVDIQQAFAQVCIVFRHDSNGHWIFGKDIYRNDIVRYEFDRIEATSLPFMYRMKQIFALSFLLWVSSSFMFISFVRHAIGFTRF